LYFYVYLLSSSLLPHPPSSTLFPYTTLFRSYAVTVDAGVVEIGGTRIRLVRGTDQNMDALVDTSRINTGVDLEASDALDNELAEDRKSTRLNSSHVSISYAVFCLKKKKTKKS